MLHNFFLACLFTVLAVGQLPSPSAAEDTTPTSPFMQEFGDSAEPFGFSMEYCKPDGQYCKDRTAAPKTVLDEKVSIEIERIAKDMAAKEQITSASDMYALTETFSMELAERLQTVLGIPSSNLLLTVVQDSKLASAKELIVLTVVTTKGDLVLGLANTEIVTWNESTYVFMKRQSPLNASRWMSLLRTIENDKGPRPAPLKKQAPPSPQKHAPIFPQKQEPECTPLIVNRSSVSRSLPYKEQLRAQLKMFGGYRDQEQTNMCAAYTAADMLTFYLPSGSKPVSALVPYVTNKLVREQNGDGFDYNKGGSVVDAIFGATSAAADLCSEEMLNSGARNREILKKLSELPTSSTQKARRLVKQLGFSLSDNHVDDILKTVNPQDRLLRVVASVCKDGASGRLSTIRVREYAFFTEFEMKFFKSNDKSTFARHAVDRNPAPIAISKILNMGDLPAIVYSVGCLFKVSDADIDSGKWTDHVSTIVERKPSKDKKQCLFRVRNSWGTLNQNEWVTSDDLKRCVWGVATRYSLPEYPNEYVPQ